MKFGAEWFHKWMDSSILNHNLYEKMTQSGLEVEKIPEKEKVFFSQVIVGRIISKIIHKKNLKYVIYQVQIQKNKVIQIIDQNKDFCNGTKILVALVGAKLLNDLIIQVKLISGFFSFGKFCSFKDLGIQLTRDNLIISFNHIKIGTNFFNYLYKNIIKVTFPMNRIDLRSVLGISRDIAVVHHALLPEIIHRPFSITEIKYRRDISIDLYKTPVQYIFREIYSVNLHKPLPFKIYERLRKFGLSCHDNVLLDIMHYIFIETGYWIHILDADLLCGNLFLKYQYNQKDLKNNELNISTNFFVLSDEIKILSSHDMEFMQNASVTLNTKNIFLGSLCVHSSYLQNYSLIIKNHDHNIDYPKYNIIPELQRNTMEYCTALIIKIFGGLCTEIKIKNSFLKKFLIPTIVLTLEKFNKITGYFFTIQKMIKILKQCKFQYLYKNNNIFFVTPPFWRTDIQIEEDVIGEIVRIYDCENTIITTPINQFIIQKDSNYENRKLFCIKSFLVNQGYYEIISYSFINSELQKLIFPKKKFFNIINPISLDMSAMRLSLWIGLIRCVAYNQNRQNKSIRIFENGLCFLSDIEKNLGINQEEHISGAISGYFNEHTWNIKYRKFDFYDLKGVVESIFKIFGYVELITFVSEKFHGLDKASSAGIYLANKLVGRIGILDDALHEQFNLIDSVILFEIFYTRFSLKKKVFISPISDLPVSKRDISIIVSDFIKSSDIIDICKKNVSLKNVEIYIYDVYHNINIPKDKKSISIRFIFENKKNMLIDREINTNIQRCVIALQTKFQAILRD
ncbi:phenylalanine--tRNA ligase subunit beta [Buchnera aphidicola]|uniref:phenylalanine--tRNA ligase subunit beta n=1 Tax=Buchnera aphidicola TaxID=9 RepID=UPI00094C8153|nr:phenylalanine--tRNA ligase subunit beta [Buchnera aphidicola]